MGSCASKLLWACCSVKRGEGQCAPPLSTQTSSCTTCMLFRHLSRHILMASHCTSACNHPSCMHEIPCPMGSLQGSVGQLTDVTPHHCPAPWRQQPHWSHVAGDVVAHYIQHCWPDFISLINAYFLNNSTNCFSERICVWKHYTECDHKVKCAAELFFSICVVLGMQEVKKKTTFAIVKQHYQMLAGTSLHLCLSLEKGPTNHCARP